MAGFDCPYCGQVRHVQEDGEDRCWNCGTRVADATIKSVFIVRGEVYGPILGVFATSQAADAASEGFDSDFRLTTVEEFKLETAL